MCNYIHMFVGHDHKELVYIIHIFFFFCLQIFGLRCDEDRHIYAPSPIVIQINDCGYMFIWYSLLLLIHWLPWGEKIFAYMS